MAWTSPSTWSTGQVVTASDLNAQIRDNMNALSTHAHTGAAGDGAAILIPSFENDKRVSFLFNVPGPNVTGDQVVTEQSNGSVGTGTWDATGKWVYVQLQTTTNTAYARGRALPLATTVLLPEYTIGCMHVSTSSGTIRLGLADSDLSADPTNGLFFRSASGGNWFAVARNGGVETATDTGIAASTTVPKEFRITVNSTSSVTFYIASSSVRVETGANIPASTVLMSARFAYQGTAVATVNAAISQWMGLSYRVRSS